MSSSKDQVNILSKSFKLPCGKKIKNRLVKAAMTESLADPKTNEPNEQHFTLYKRWSDGGIGMQITGNVFTDRRYLENPRNIVLDDQSNLENFKKWTSAIKGDECIAILQISHPGRQCPVSVTSEPVGPSSVPANLPVLGDTLSRILMKTPRALTINEIDEIINQFVNTTKLSIQVGFNGVQIHAAHGYLINQFLSPSANRRTDEYGCQSIENKSRLLINIISQIKSKLSLPKDFIISVKLNSSDFQKDGLTEEDSRHIIKLLENLKVDFIEISGGTYENAQMLQNPDQKIKESTLKREAYFLEFAKTVRKISKCPLMVTGGFRSRKGINDALLNDATDFIGLGRPLCLDVNLPKKFINMECDEALSYTLQVGIADKLLVPSLNNFWHSRQIELISMGENPNVKLGYAFSLTVQFIRTYFFDHAKVQADSLYYLNISILLAILFYLFLIQ